MSSTECGPPAVLESTQDGPETEAAGELTGFGIARDPPEQEGLAS